MSKGLVADSVSHVIQHTSQVYAAAARVQTRAHTLRNRIPTSPCAEGGPYREVVATTGMISMAYRSCSISRIASIRTSMATVATPRGWVLRVFSTRYRVS